MIDGTMMSFPLTLAHVLRRAAALFPDSPVASRLPDRSLHRYRYADFCERAGRLAGALQALGLRRGDRVATLMWNHYAHLEAYFAAPCAGAVLHTLNLRLHPDDIAWIANHAGDRFLIVDDVLLPLYEKIRHAARFERVIVVPLTGAAVAADCLDYERLLAQAPAPQWPEPGENEAAGMCYTSGTTGRPKGVVYTHRSIVLHSLAISARDYLGVGNRDGVCPVVPMFHVNAWGLPFASVMMGAGLAMPGPHLDGASLLDLWESESVTIAAGVPTLWSGVLQALDAAPGRWRLAPDLRLVVGGAAAPESLIAAFDRHGLDVVPGWGMTETSPVGTFNFPTRAVAGESGAGRLARRARAGVPLPFVEVRAMTDSGPAPRDGATMGELQVRGPWVAAAYHDAPDGPAQWTQDGWFRTGDIATIDAGGYVRITDRIKDLVKSGGEWISTVDLENALTGHPKVAEAAVIGVPHPKWDERPIAVVVRKPGETVTAGELSDHLAPRFARYWLPDAYVFVDAIPRSSTGKLLKAQLREQYRDWRWSE